MPDNLDDCLDNLRTAHLLIGEAARLADASWRAGEPIARCRERLLQLCADIEDDANNLPGLVSQEDE